MAVKKPLQALVYGMGLVISVLAGVIVYQNTQLGNAKDERTLALKTQADEFRSEIKEARQEAVDARRETKDCRDQVVSRTDLFVDKITQGYQKQIDEARQIEKERSKLYRQRSNYIIKDKINLNELNKVTSQDNEN